MEKRKLLETGSNELSSTCCLFSLVYSSLVFWLKAIGGKDRIFPEILAGLHFISVLSLSAGHPSFPRFIYPFVKVELMVGQLPVYENIVKDLGPP